MSTILTTESRCSVINLTTDWEELRPQWDRFVEQHPKGGVFHSSPMVRVFEATKGYTPLALAAVTPDGEILALLVAVRVRSIPRLVGAIASRSIWYAEPLCEDSDEGIAALCQLVDHHDQLMRRRVLFAEIRPGCASGPERIALERCGYQYLDYLNFTVDTTQPKEVLLKRMRDSARASIRKCEKRGFQIRHVNTAEGIDVLYDLLRRTYGHAEVPLADRSLFDAAFRILHPLGLIELVGIYNGDEVVAMDVILPYKNDVVAWYGGSIRMPNVSPVDLLQWHEIAWSVEHGYGRFDFGGAGWPDISYGVRDYKAKFGGDLVCYGRYRKVYSPWKMALAERAYQFGRTLISPKCFVNQLLAFGCVEADFST
jgi:CelD/BcsL family acetyltransferase involved in cellulose biosynthesis